MSELPESLRANPSLSRWVRPEPGGTVAVRSGKVELGQGILTALAQIAAEELDVDVARVRMVPADTCGGPDEGLTAGSLSVQRSGAALRQACAQVRARALDMAAERLGVPAGRLVVRDGGILAPDGRHTSYWDLAGCADGEAGPPVPTKPTAAYTVVGSGVARLDLTDKVTGQPRFIHDLALPGMCYGRMLHAPYPGARLVALDDAAARRLPGVLAVLRDGDLAGVVAEREEVAVRAADLLAGAARWSGARRPCTGSSAR